MECPAARPPKSMGGQDSSAKPPNPAPKNLENYTQVMAQQLRSG
jgi:hypothetical protein